MPPPGVIREYDEIHPGAAQMILDQFVKEGDERREFYRRDQRHRFIDGLVGRLIVFVFIVCALSVSAYAISRGFEIAAAVVGGSPLAVGIGYLMKTRRKTPDA